MSDQGADGGKVEGVAALDALVTQWAAETAGQEPSKDVLSFTAALSDVVGPDAVRAALGDVLSGHKHAWRIEEDDGQTRVHVVTSAASAERDDAGRSRRLFDNNKSIGALHDRIELAFNAKVGFEERGWAHGTEGVTRYLSRLTRDGRTPGVTSTGQILDNHDGNLEVAASRKGALRSREPRDTAHIILSAKAGTPRDAFVDAARATLAREFAGHKYAFALHTDKRHVHVHAIVRLDNIRGGGARTTARSSGKPFRGFRYLERSRLRSPTPLGYIGRRIRRRGQRPRCFLPGIAPRLRPWRHPGTRRSVMSTSPILATPKSSRRVLIQPRSSWSAPRWRPSDATFPDKATIGCAYQLRSGSAAPPSKAPARKSTDSAIN